LPCRRTDARAECCDQNQRERERLRETGRQGRQGAESREAGSQEQGGREEGGRETGEGDRMRPATN